MIGASTPPTSHTRSGSWERWHSRKVVLSGPARYDADADVAGGAAAGVAVTRWSARSRRWLGGMLGYVIGAVLYDFGRALADPSLWPWRQGRGLSRVLCRMGRADHPAEGADADPLQARHHHFGICRLQHLAVRAVLDHCSRRTFLRGRGAAQPLWRFHSGRTGKTAGFLGQRSHRDTAAADFTSPTG